MKKITLNYDESNQMLYDKNGIFITAFSGLVSLEHDRIGIDVSSLIKLKEAGFDADEIIKMRESEVI